MNKLSILEFIQQTMEDLAEEYQIPESFIPDLIGLLRRYPNVEEHGKKTELRDKLKLLIENLKNERKLDQYAD